jgi:hypothetical protein
MKKTSILIYSLLFAASTFAYSPRNIDEKLVHSFQTNFPHAERVSWEELPGQYVVSFVDNGILSRITYLKKGSDIASYVRYYMEETLPFSIRSEVKRRYPNKKIQGVVEVSAPLPADDEDAAAVLTTVYYIRLEGAGTLINIRMSSDGNSEVVEKFKKAN